MSPPVNPPTTRIPAAGRTTRSPVTSRERTDDAGFGLALGAAVAAQPPARPEPTPPAPDNSGTEVSVAAEGQPRAAVDSPDAAGSGEGPVSVRPLAPSHDAERPAAQAMPAPGAAGVAARWAAPSLTPPAGDPAIAAVRVSAPPAPGEVRTPVADPAPASRAHSSAPPPPPGAPDLVEGCGLEARVLSSRLAPQPVRAATTAVLRPAPAPAGGAIAPAAPDLSTPAALPSAGVVRPAPQSAVAAFPGTSPSPAAGAGAPPAPEPVTPHASPEPAPGSSTAPTASAHGGDAPRDGDPGPTGRAGSPAPFQAASSIPGGARADAAAPHVPAPSARATSMADARAAASTDAAASGATNRPPVAAGSAPATGAPATVSGSGSGRQAGSETPSRDDGEGPARDRASLRASDPAVATGPAVPSDPGAGEAQGTLSRPGAPAAPARPSVPATATGLQDPRLEPMRRAADQVTLQFNGEDGLQGRLRIAVRGDTVRASILSSDPATLERLGGELGSLRKALAEQGFTQTRVAVHDTRGTGGVNDSAGARQEPRAGEERRHGEPQRRSGHGREPRQDNGSDKGRRPPRDERRSE